MEVTIPGGSPLIRYTPCRSCNRTEGWSAPDGEGDGADHGWLTASANATAGLNFTGTGLQFNVEYAGGDQGAWEVELTVNGTAPPKSANTTLTGVTHLPAGRHEFVLTLKRPAGRDDSDTWARVNSVTGQLGYVTNSQSSNTTIDDTQWATGAIVLSTGWNMLEQGQSNYLNPDEFYQEQETAGRNLNNSLSWTSKRSARSTIQFDGSAVWVYGVSGDDAGSYEVLIDDKSQGRFDASGGPKVYQQTLFTTSGLSDGPHSLTLINRRGRLAFDYLMAAKGLEAFAEPPLALTNGTTSLPMPTGITPINAPIPTRTGSSLSSGKPSETAIDDASSDKDHAVEHKGSNIKLIVGASVGSIVGLLVLTLVAFLIWVACRRRKQKRQRHAPPNAWKDEKPRHAQGKGWQFVNLPDDRVGSELGNAQGTYLETPRRQDTHTSGSSFGSAIDAESPTEAPVVAAPVPVAHTRHSLLPFKNNLWAKEKDEPLDDDPLPVHDMNARPNTSSPDPMLAALYGAASPLTELQRTYSTDPKTNPPTPRTPKTQTPVTPQNARTPLNVNTEVAKNSEKMNSAEMPKVGTYEWYNWFGLGPPQEKSDRTKSPSGLSNMFRRSGSTKGSDHPIHLDPRAATTAAEERSPRRRHFGNDAKRGNADSMWARWN